MSENEKEITIEHNSLKSPQNEIKIATQKKSDICAKLAHIKKSEQNIYEVLHNVTLYKDKLSINQV